MSLHTLDLNLLRILDTVLSERSVARSAKCLHVTPSAISNALARLRSVLGDPLVVRHGRGIVPTPRAAEMAPLLKRVLGDLERAVRIEVFSPATTTRQFTIALSDAGQITRLPAISQLLFNEMPHAQLRVIGIDTYLSWGGAASMEVDVALAAIDEHASGVFVSPLYGEESVLIARKRHRLMGKRISKEQLANLQHIDVQVSPGRGYRDLARNYVRLGIERRVAIVAPSFVAAAAIVATSDFVATIPTSLVNILGKPLDIHALRAPVPIIKTMVKLVWHERTNEDQAAHAFREIVTRAIGQLQFGR